MNYKEFADMLTGREAGEETNKEDMKIAKDNRLVVVTGASDDLMEFYGCINDEVGCFNGGSAFVTKKGILVNECDDEDCPYYQDKLDRGEYHVIEALWCDEEGYSWTYKTDIPHSTFEIMEDGEHYCRGIVFSIDDLKY